MSENHRHLRAPRLCAALASVAMAAVLLVVPAALPLCGMEMDPCAVEVSAVPAGTHCALAGRGEVAGLPEMPCCVQDTSPQGPAPAAPGKADTDLRLQLKAQAPAPTLAQALFAAPAVAAPEPVPQAVPTASAVPLYTLLSSLLN